MLVAAGLRVVQNCAHGADDINPEMIEETGILGGQDRLDHLGRNFIKGNGVILPDAALADDLAIGIGEGDGKFPALVPHIAGARKGRQREGQKTKGENHADGGAVIQQIDQEAARACDLEAVNKGGIGRAPALAGIPGLENARTHKRVEGPEHPENGVAVG